jgi:hypothetical protein
MFSASSIKNIEGYFPCGLVLKELGASSVVGVLSGLQASRIRSLSRAYIETVFPASSIKNTEGSFPLWSHLSSGARMHVRLHKKIEKNKYKYTEYKVRHKYNCAIGLSKVPLC